MKKNCNIAGLTPVLLTPVLFEATDIYQQYAPSWLPGGSSPARQAEAVAERAGNAAGWAVGGLIKGFLSSNKAKGDYDNLKKNIKSTLCDGGGLD